MTIMGGVQTHCGAKLYKTSQMQLKTKLNTIFLQLKDRFFSFQNNLKNLDPSYKLDLDLWDCLGRVKLIFNTAKFHRTDLVICSLSR